jgi:proline iminopeptidase
LAGDDIHNIYYEQSGNASGIPIVLLHGGPGSNNKASKRQLFNHDFYRIILFDQRGCGQSTPFGELTNNTTPHLIADMEALRTHLNIEQWAVCGGSWGSTLALAYAQTHPDKVLGMVVNAVFTAESWMLNWFGQDGLDKFFPDAYATLQEDIPHKNPQECIAQRQKLLAGTREEQLKATTYTAWECAGMTLPAHYIGRFTYSTPEEEDAAIRYAKIFTHYEANAFFLNHTSLVEGCRQLGHIPCEILHGRYDMCCPLKGAYDVHKAWPNSRLTIIPDAAHDFDQYTQAGRARVYALDRLALQLTA